MCDSVWCACVIVCGLACMIVYGWAVICMQHRTWIIIRAVISLATLHSPQAWDNFNLLSLNQNIVVLCSCTLLMACVMGCFCAYTYNQYITKLERAQHIASRSLFPTTPINITFIFIPYALISTSLSFLLLVLIPHSSLPSYCIVIYESLCLSYFLAQSLVFPTSINTSPPLPFLLSSSTAIPLADLRQRYGSSSMAAPSSSLGRISVINDLAF